ncbi:inorganic pyrophosphatase [Candidatus Kaiserbacteria bacterium CG10_big_fil_rev_8_21_14_0_10_51_14]|uniref:Inorganic pyrophosphatase n=1 Tax=Candidatus Kaiserbacteria bacterium CG10_big_fil_rev_8_21_14_0_10_51_14 TaxID=1974610 RepID=A0A2H0UCX9_9BACT|nr:MAG: inorganic pyrophosphatase [Candidatus Kaiserbacteria bacterium CG10_big_fil_rev_8_21_14_0_10_51_14]
MNLWHDVPLGENAPEEFNAIIEIPRGSHNKYEIDKATGLIKLDRANYSSAPFPYDYGFAPQTYWDDNDPLDVIVLTTYPLFPGILVAVRPVAVIDMMDDGDSDYKIIAVPVDDKRWDDVQDLPDLNKHNVKEYQHFLETYKALKGKPAPVEIKGIYGKKEATEAVKKSVRLYTEKFGK